MNTAFETYLECGSIAETAATLSRLGYRTKSYTSRREVYHPPKEFSTTSVQHLLKNVGYIGKRPSPPTAIAGTGPRSIWCPPSGRASSPPRRSSACRH